MIEARELSFTYSSGFSIKCSEFKAPKGAITCLIGSNGSGKSTLLKLIGGRLEPKTGDIYIEGRSLPEHNKDEIEKYIGWLDVSSSELLVEHMCIREHLALALLLARKPVPLFYNQLKSEMISDYLKISPSLLEITESIEKRIYRLSAGQRQLISILLGIIGEKKVIFCDESTAHLDYSNANLFFKEIAKIAGAQKSAIVIITHDLLLAAEYGDNHYILLDGTVKQINLSKTMDIADRIAKLKELIT